MCIYICIYLYINVYIYKWVSPMEVFYSSESTTGSHVLVYELLKKNQQWVQFWPLPTIIALSDPSIKLPMLVKISI